MFPISLCKFSDVSEQNVRVGRSVTSLNNSAAVEQSMRRKDLLHLTGFADFCEFFKKNSVPAKFYICTTNIRYARKASLLHCCVV